MLKISWHKVFLFTLGGFAFGFFPCVGAAQSPTEPMPVITIASVPLYPLLARQAHIEGDVRLERSTDGERVASVSIVSGQPMLAQAAKESIGTWRFRPHARIKFQATFRYKLVSVPQESRCSATNDNSTVVLRFPVDVEISANEMWICDPASTVR